MDKHKLGPLGEKLAREHLKKHGYKIIKKNYQQTCGEIDIICRKKQELIFVEVKSGQTPSKFGSPLEKITPNKLKTIEHTAQIFLIKKKIPTKPRLEN